MYRIYIFGFSILMSIIIICTASYLIAYYKCEKLCDISSGFKGKLFSYTKDRCMCEVGGQVINLYSDKE